MKMKVINMAMKKVGDDKLRRKVVSFLLVTLMMATITPVHADEVSEPTTAATEVTTTETKPTTTEKKETTHHKEKTVKKDKKTKKKSTKKDGKKKSKQKEKSKKKENKKSTIPMPKRAVKKKGCDTVQKKIVKMQSKIKKLQKEQKNIRKEIKKENNKKEALQRFYQQYPTEREATMKLRGQKITPLTKISEEDDALRNRLFSLANTFHDDQLRKIASEYVFGVRDLNFEDLLNEDDTIDLNTYLKGKYIAPTQNMQIGIKNKDQEIQKLKKQIKEEKKTRFFDPKNVNSISNITVDDAKKMLSGTQLYPEAEAFVKAERIHHVNAVFLMGIAAHESAWGTSRRAREDNNLTGYGVYSDSAKGINKPSKEEGLLATAETLHERYLTPGGSYYEGTSVADVNKHYCVGNEWAGAVVGYAYQLMNKLN